MKKIMIIVGWMVKLTRSYLKAFVIIFVFNIILSLCGVGMVIASKELIDAAIGGFWKNAILSGVILGGIILLQVCLKAAVSMLSVRTSQTMSNHLREKLYLHLSSVYWRDFTKYHSGDIVTRLTNDIGIIVEGMVEDLPEIVSLAIGLCASFITLFIFDPFLALFALLLVPVAILISHFIGKRFMEIHLKAKAAESKYRSFLQECIEHMLVLKSFCKEKSSGEKLGELQEECRRLTIRSNRTMISAGSLVTGGYWFSYFTVFGWGAMRLAEGTTTFGTFTAFIQLVGQIQQPFMGLAQSLPQLFSMAASAKRLMEFENLRNESYGNTESIEDLKSINFDYVSFGYDENKEVLNNVSARVHAGDIIGLMGASGEGKTTLIHLLMSLYEPSTGRIYLKSSNSRYYIASASIRNMISYVPQGNTLFSGTISENLKIGCPNATEEEQIEVLKGVDAWDFVSKLAEGMHSTLGERGQGLSEGQVQRIAIARALIRKTPILLLDEATSALDMEAERRVLEYIVTLHPRRTCIIITHRTSMFQYCNRVWNLSQGVLSESSDSIKEVAASEAI